MRIIRFLRMRGENRTWARLDGRLGTLNIEDVFFDTSVVGFFSPIFNHLPTVLFSVCSHGGGVYLPWPGGTYFGWGVPQGR